MSSASVGPKFKSFEFLWVSFVRTDVIIRMYIITIIIIAQ
jgi:hypothetical protein